MADTPLSYSSNSSFGYRNPNRTLVTARRVAACSELVSRTNGSEIAIRMPVTCSGSTCAAAASGSSDFRLSRNFDGAGLGNPGNARASARLTSAGPHGVSVVAMVGALRISVNPPPRSIMESAEKPDYLLGPMPDVPNFHRHVVFAARRFQIGSLRHSSADTWSA
jgi:hypothetical protein